MARSAAKSDRDPGRAIRMAGLQGDASASGRRGDPELREWQGPQAYPLTVPFRDGNPVSARSHQRNSPTLPRGYALSPMEPMRVIETGTFVLEPQVVAHAEEMFAVLSDPAIYEYENEPPGSVDELRQRFARLESRRPPAGEQPGANRGVRAPPGRPVGSG